MRRTLLVLLASVAVLTGVAAAPAQAADAPAQTTTATTAAASATLPGDPTLAQRNAYVKYVAGVTEVSYTLRIRLLKYGYRACEGITAKVPSIKIVAGLKVQYHLSSAEAWRVFYGARRYLCP